MLIIKKHKKILNIEIDQEEFNAIKYLRNRVMHHNLLMFSSYENENDVLKEISILENDIMTLWKLIHSKRKKEFEKAINNLNYKGGRYEKEKPNLEKFCLRILKDGIFIKRSNT